MFDFRKTSQYIPLGKGKIFYIWRKPKGEYDCGVNGTSYHYICKNQSEVVEKYYYLSNNLEKVI